MTGRGSSKRNIPPTPMTYTSGHSPSPSRQTLLGARAKKRPVMEFTEVRTQNRNRYKEGADRTRWSSVHLVFLALAAPVKANSAVGNTGCQEPAAACPLEPFTVTLDFVGHSQAMYLQEWEAGVGFLFWWILKYEDLAMREWSPWRFPQMW